MDTPAEFARSNLAAFVKGRATAALEILDPPPGYGPRIWLPFREKKRIARLLREIISEAGWGSGGRQPAPECDHDWLMLSPTLDSQGRVRCMCRVCKSTAQLVYSELPR